MPLPQALTRGSIERANLDYALFTEGTRIAENLAIERDGLSAQAHDAPDLFSRARIQRRQPDIIWLIAHRAIGTAIVGEQVCSIPRIGKFASSAPSRASMSAMLLMEGCSAISAPFGENI